jgi:putative FmdB family regulatory protein
MPIYAYKCQDCKKTFEEFFLSFSAVEKEEPTLKCPHCGSEKKEKQIAGGTNFQLKGRGWAKDRYSK